MSRVSFDLVMTLGVLSSCPDSIAPHTAPVAVSFEQCHFTVRGKGGGLYIGYEFSASL